MIWLYEQNLRQIPTAVQRRINEEPIGLSPFVQLELDYLYELGRTGGAANAVVNELQLTLELAPLDVSSASVCRVAAGLTWTRDPFDRLLAAHATVAQLPLVTKDRTLRRHLSLAWWSD